MKIKYKLVLLIIIITLTALLPVSIILLQRQENERMTLLQHQGEVFSQFLAQSVTTIILSNGADIPTCRVDAREMISSLRSLTSDGLVFAEAILVSPRDDYNGIVLARFDSTKGALTVSGSQKIEPGELEEIREISTLKEISLPGNPGICYDFAAYGSLPGKEPVCICRLVYSKQLVLASVQKMRLLTYSIVAAAIAFIGFLGYFLSRFISKPIVALTNTAQMIENGNFDIDAAVISRDEVGVLSNTFNHMLRLIKMKITELEETNRRLVDLDVLKDEFLANISHELKTPLYGMVGIAETLIRGSSGPLNDDALNNIKTIIASGKSLGNLVNDILDFSKMRHYDIDLNIQPVDIYDVAEYVLSIARPLLGKKNLKLENNIASGTALVSGDESRLQQILLNLVGNAVKFTESGSVRVGVHTNANDEVVVTVSDTGIGISSDMYDKIFEPFLQLDGSITRKYGGSGLGLAITRKLVELHGGTLRVESEPGKGSVFSFTLKKSGAALSLEAAAQRVERRKQIVRLTHADRRANKKPAADKVCPPPKQTGQSARILVVDDEPVNLLIMINHLKMEGYEIITAENAEQVEAMLERCDIPDVILLDVMLPRVSGFDLCRKIRESYSSHELPVIMLTVRQSTQDIVAGISAGANDYLIKPVNGEELCARVANLISMKNSIKAQSELRIIRNELDLAIELQKNILPATLPDIKDLSFAVRYIPSSHVSGDFYDYHIINDSSIGVILADVTGHGVPAAMIASMMQMAYSFSKMKHTEPSEILSEINSILSIYPHELYLTACCILVQIAQRRMRYSNAGHPSVLVYRRAEKRLLNYTVFGRPIGMFEESEYSTIEIELKPGDRIIMHTDGIPEARNPFHENFGDERFHALICDNIGLSPDEFADRVVRSVYDWTKISPDRGLKDDVTLIVFDFMM